MKDGFSAAWAFLRFAAGHSACHSLVLPLPSWCCVASAWVEFIYVPRHGSSHSGAFCTGSWVYSRLRISNSPATTDSYVGVAPPPDERPSLLRDRTLLELQGGLRRGRLLSVSAHICNWRASEASETLSGVTNGNRRYIYIWYVQDTFVVWAQWYVMWEVPANV